MYAFYVTSVDEWKSPKRPQNENSVIIFLPSFHSTPVWLTVRSSAEHKIRDFEDVGNQFWWPLMYILWKKKIIRHFWWQTRHFKSFRNPVISPGNLLAVMRMRCICSKLIILMLLQGVCSVYSQKRFIFITTLWDSASVIFEVINFHRQETLYIHEYMQSHLMVFK